MPSTIAAIAIPDVMPASTGENPGSSHAFPRARALVAVCDRHASRQPYSTVWRARSRQPGGASEAGRRSARLWLRHVAADPCPASAPGQRERGIPRAGCAAPRFDRSAGRGGGRRTVSLDDACLPRRPGRHCRRRPRRLGAVYRARRVRSGQHCRVGGDAASGVGAGGPAGPADPASGVGGPHRAIRGEARRRGADAQGARSRTGRADVPGMGQEFPAAGRSCPPGPSMELRCSSP